MLSCLVSEAVNPTRALSPLPFFLLPLAITIAAAPFLYALSMILLRRITASREEQQAAARERLAFHAALIAYGVTVIATASIGFILRSA
jgi:uncharacterized membrane protein